MKPNSFNYLLLLSMQNNALVFMVFTLVLCAEEHFASLIVPFCSVKYVGGIYTYVELWFLCSSKYCARLNLDCLCFCISKKNIVNSYDVFYIREYIGILIDNNNCI